jgi:hypothetical protein
LWKEAQQEVRQHWFIDSYIAAYLQVQYRVGGVHPTGLTVARGVGRCPHFDYSKVKICRKLPMNLVIGPNNQLSTRKTVQETLRNNVYAVVFAIFSANSNKLK